MPDMNNTKNHILLVVHTNSYFTGLLPLAKLLNRSPIHEPIFLFTRYYPTLPIDLGICQKELIAIILGRQAVRELKFEPRPDEADPQKGSKLVKRIRRYLRYLKSPSDLVAVLLDRIFGGTLTGETFRLAWIIKSIRKIIRQEKISLLVLPADNRYDQAAYVKAAHLERRGAVVIPQFMASHLEWAEYVWDQKPYKVEGFFNKLAARRFPNWVLDYKGRKLLAQSGIQILAREGLGIAPPLPWILHSGHADAIAVESQAVQQYCLDEGLPSKILVVTGSVSLDVIFETSTKQRINKTELCRLIAEDVRKPIILSALPPDSIYMGRPECDFQVYDELVDYWCKSISSITKFLHIVCLHPSVTYEEMKHIESYGLKISPLPTMEVIGLCDLFVASISSTIQWAIACGIPVLNYDVYRYRYTDYQGLGGVITTEEQDEFLKYLDLMTSNDTFRSRMISAQRESSKKWGNLDGKSGDRLQDLFLSVMARYSNEDINA